MPDFPRTIIEEAIRDVHATLQLWSKAVQDPLLRPNVRGKFDVELSKVVLYLCEDFSPQTSTSIRDSVLNEIWNRRLFKEDFVRELRQRVLAPNTVPNLDGIVGSYVTSCFRDVLNELEDEDREG